jgi:hypothetical protein
MSEQLRIGYDAGNGTDIPVLTVGRVIRIDPELGPMIQLVNTFYGGSALELYYKLTSPGQCEAKKGDL